MDKQPTRNRLFLPTKCDVKINFKTIFKRFKRLLRVRYINILKNF